MKQLFGQLLTASIILTSCSYNKETKTQDEGDKKTEIKKIDGYCIRDYECRSDMENVTNVSVIYDSANKIKVQTRLTCLPGYSYSNKVISNKGIPCDSMIYRYNHNILTINYSFNGKVNKLEITNKTFYEFLEDKRLADIGYIGDGYSLEFSKQDTTLNLRIPIYFREIDVGEIATVLIDKNGKLKIKALEKYEGFVPD
jgi:hypothetical protein